MPWRNGPDFWDLVIGATAILIATAMGAIAKIADDVKNGNRRKFWSKKLWLDIPAVLMMVILACGLTEYFDLSPGAGSGLGTVLGWLGPRAVEVFLGHKFRHWGKGHDDRRL